MFCRQALRPALLATALTTLAAAMAAPAMAQTAPAAAGQNQGARLSFQIASGPLAGTLNAIAVQAGLVASVDPALVDGKRAPAVQGRFTVGEALRQGQAGSGLELAMTGTAANSVRPAARITPPEVPTAALAPVVVRAAAYEGATTEDSGSYAARSVTIGRAELKLREIPQAVSVVTRQQMDDQNLNSLLQVLETTNGATIIKNDDSLERSEVYYRGFKLDSLKVDGVSVSTNVEVTTFDTAIYDRVEILRGPAGVLQGAGEPSGTVNLVRKRAPGAFAGKAEVTLGEWNRQRAEVDVGGALVESGAIRGRVVALSEQGDSYVDLVNSRRSLAFGTLNFDLSPRTTLTLGATHQTGESRDSRGLPAYTDGSLLRVPRSTFIGSDWAHNDTRSKDVFASLEHYFDNGALLNVSSNYLDRTRDSKLAFADGGVNPANGNTRLLPQHRLDAETNFNFDASLNVPFTVAGLDQSVLLGTDYRKAATEGTRARAARIAQNVFTPQHDLPEPDFDFNLFDRVRTQQHSIYGQTRIKPVEWGTLVLGGRMSWWDSQTSDRVSHEITASSRIDRKFTPYAGLVVDLSPQLSAYASTAAIFVPQSGLTIDREALPARSGRQYELGLKGDTPDGRLNARVALFRINDRNRALADAADDNYFVASGEVQSSGFEAEVSGAITPAWQVIAGYTYLTSRYERDPALAGTTFQTRSPRHSLRLWTKYTLQSEALRGFDIGGGLRASSNVYAIDAGQRLDAPGHAVLDLRLGYRFNRNLSASLSVSNVLDRSYYQTVSYLTRQNYYGDPRAVTLSLQARF
ncbi:MAG: TonB-dependent siderophore receptor [Comamonas sp.]